MGVAKFGPLNKCRRGRKGNGPDEVGEIVAKLQAIFAVKHGQSAARSLLYD